ncbi:MAG: 2-amino-4-hydroxy-6-hydroxymethyldihydropteridine diphosphokinase [Nevskiaceae bacterium]|nr:MAG: 2-amino-4-hydroxy-6-hydroxymethyldihydropteridine diphosphokinase [Nevskiaceae bacterium]TBR73521.1 MAG: 2-amino-4-hydroxy-6-hydroxymethyldihydropteridine diphosphokinase [Nevskiaceae bacterium]
MSEKPWTPAWIGLGANLGSPERQVATAIITLAQVPGVKMLRRSRYWRSKAIGPQPQPDYCNAACAIETQLEPEALLNALLDLEDAAGRTRTQRWGPRVLDLDLLHMQGVLRATTRLTLPHPQISRRAFVLVPLAEVAPRLDIPGVGVVGERAADCDRSDLRLWLASAPPPAPATTADSIATPTSIPAPADGPTDGES